MRVKWVLIAMTLPATLAGCHTAPVDSPDVGRYPTRATVRRVTSAALPVRPAEREADDDSDDEVAIVPVDEEITLTAFEDIFEDTDVPPASPIEGEPAALTLADLEGLALEHNPSLASAGARVDAAWGRHVQAGLYPNPVIGYHGTEIGNLNTAGQQGGFIAQRFITGGKLQLDQAIAGKQIEQRGFEFNAQQQRVMSDVRLHFYDALVAQRRIELTGELARIGDKLVESSRTLLANQQISDNDLLQAEIEAEQAHILRDNAHHQDAESWRRLTVVVGLPELEPARLAGQLTSDVSHHQWDDALASLLGRSPELAAAQARVDRARFAIARARRENVPDIDLSVSIRHINPTDSDVANVQAGIPIPIFDKNQGNILEAHSELVAAQNDVRRIELDLQDRLAVAFRRYKNAREQIERYQSRILERAQKSLDLVKNGFETGQVEYLTLDTSQRTFIRVNLAYLDAVKEFWSATTLIDGQLLSGSLSKRD